MLYRYLGLAGHVVYWKNTQFSSSFLSHQACMVLLEIQHQMRPPLPWDSQWDRNKVQDMLQERMEWVVLAIGKTTPIMDVQGQAEERKKSPEWRGYDEARDTLGQLQWMQWTGSRLFLDWKCWSKTSFLPSLKNSIPERHRKLSQFVSSRRQLISDLMVVLKFLYGEESWLIRRWLFNLTWKAA